MLELEDIPEDIKFSGSFSMAFGVVLDTFLSYCWFFISHLKPEPTYDSGKYHMAPGKDFEVETETD